MRDRFEEGGTPRVLMIAHRVPFPPDKGDRIRTYNLLLWLSRRAVVDLACLADAPVDGGAMVALQRLCGRIAVARNDGPARWARVIGSLALGRTASEGAFDSPSLRSTVRRWAGEVRYRAVLASASSLAPYLRIGAIRNVPAVVDMVDVDSQKWFDYADDGRPPLSWFHRLEGRRLRRLERSLPDRSHAVVLVSQAEADLYRRVCRSGPVFAVTNGVNLGAFRSAEDGAEERGCVFVGALDYRPNVDGARWLCRDVWPRVVARAPGATIRLVGRDPAPAIRRLAGAPGVELVGRVPDVRPYIEEAAVVVAPLRIARGVQNKVLEAMALGKATVASPQAIAGLGVEPGRHVLAASSPEQWAEAVLRLLDNEPLRRRIGAAGRRYVEEHHRWDRCLAPMGPILRLPADPAPAGA